MAATLQKLSGFALIAGCGLAAGCDGPRPPLPERPDYWKQSDAGEIAAAFASKAPDRWRRYGDGIYLYRIEGDVVRHWGTGERSHSIAIAAQPIEVVLGSVDIPAAYMADVEPGKRIAVFCEGAGFDPIGDAGPVLMSNCRLDPAAFPEG